MANEVTTSVLFPLERVQERNGKTTYLSPCSLQRIKTCEKIDLTQVPYLKLRKNKINSMRTIVDLDEITRLASKDGRRFLYRVEAFFSS